MRITRIDLLNVRSFKKLSITLSKSINILVGANNSGKSTILHAAASIQNNSLVEPKDIRIGATESNIELILDGDVAKYFPNRNEDVYRYDLKTNSKSLAGHPVNIIPSAEPDNFIYPYLSKRKLLDIKK